MDNQDVQCEIDSVWTSHHGRVEPDNTGYAPKTVWKWNSSVTEDKDGMLVFPTGMCMNTFTADVGYGSNDDYPCADKATHIVTFKVWAPELDNPDGWDQATMNLCDRCKVQMSDESDKDTDFMRIVSSVPYQGEYDGREV